MRLALRYIVFSGIAFFTPSLLSVATAQDRCGTVPYSKALHPDYRIRRINFEKWIAQHKLPRRQDPSARQQTSLYRIPVVVHIIHDGEPVGEGANISDAQILSQIKVLNDDFQRQNADAVNTPPEFAAVAGNLDIEFVLAKQDPDGLPTNGIVRVDGNRSGWTINDNYTLKELSYWPAEQYMNIWVCNLSDLFVGWAQPPESDLEGLEDSSTNRLTDGVVVWHGAFGSSDDGPFDLDPAFNKGRTTTHEVGHFFGLNHIWGDDPECNGTDYVSDTPNQGNRTQGCPAHPKIDNCGQVVMFQNFLDYTDDACMNLFTQGQVERMSIVIENSPRRNSLLSSPGLEAPDPLPNDIGIRSVVFPDASVCSNIVTPVIEVRNYGSNTITSTRIRFVVDGTTLETKDVVLSLNPQEAVNINFNAVTIPSGEHNISFQVLLTNGVTDAGSYNNFQSSTVILPAFASVPLAENFNTAPPGWIIQNPDGQLTWEAVTAPSDMPGNKALKLNYFDYEDKIGEIDIFLSPVLDLSSVPAATVTFDVAYARYQSSNDRLQVVVLSNCQDIGDGTIRYNKAGDELKTAPSTAQPFTPANESQWRKELIDLSDFIGMDRVQLAFIGINDWGNNIYLDNVTLITEQTRDASLIRMVTPSVVTCEQQVSPKLLIQNAGSVLLNSLVVDYAINNSAVQTLALDNLNVSFGAEKEIELPAINLMEGENILTVTLKDPNGGLDHNPDDNEETFAIVVNVHQDRIPLRLNFDDHFTSEWTVINPAGGMNWELIQTNFGQSLYFNAFDNELAGDEAWLVSPVLDFSGTSQASLLFDISHKHRPGKEETLTLLASTDCGLTFQEISYQYPDTDVHDISWMPQNEDDWRRNIAINLNSLAGLENVRIAFVIRNQNGNNLYLDNIEFFVTADPDPIEIAETYAVYGYDLSDPQLTDLRITFNLPERQEVRFTIINSIGQIETDGIIGDVLNQTYPLSPSQRLAAGIYFIRVQIGGRYYTSRIMVF